MTRKMADMRGEKHVARCILSFYCAPCDVMRGVFLCSVRAHHKSHTCSHRWAPLMEAVILLSCPLPLTNAPLMTVMNISLSVNCPL